MGAKMTAPLTPAGESAVADIAARYRVSDGAVRTLLDAVARGGGAMAQFSHPELGGNGQWMRGGMTMVGDMFNPGLQATVSGICSELSALLASGGVLVRPSDAAAAGGGFGGFGGQAWWPEGLGRPSSSGGQNDASYAYFPGPQRLAIRRSGAITLYHTLDHAISGVQQQQGGRGSLEFSSQHGTFTVDTLPVVGGGTLAPAAHEPVAESPAAESPAAESPAAEPPAAEPPTPQGSPAAPPAPVAASIPAAVPAPASPEPAAPAPVGVVTSAAEIGAAIETLASLRDKGFVTEAEFAAKKAELLARL
jgi:Short C-terminal domain